MTDESQLTGAAGAAAEILNALSSSASAEYLSAATGGAGPLIDTGPPTLLLGPPTVLLGTPTWLPVPGGTDMAPLI